VETNVRPLVVPPFAVVLAALSCIPQQRPGDTLMPAPKHVDNGSLKGSDLDAARELDQEGVRAFAAGRYREAIHFFNEARRLGGPATELWNIARCHDRLDEPEESAKAIEAYLAETIGTDERTDAQRELERLKMRSSTLVAITAPPGAAVTIDGQPASGATPLSAELPAGSHTVAFKRDGYAPKTVRVDARFGRGVILEIELVKGAK
jgi:hypothetical protein